MRIENTLGDGIKVPIQKLISLLAAAAVAVLLSSCVTTTTGGHMVEASEQQAVQDYIRLAIAYYDSDDLITSRRHLNNALAIDARNADAYNVLASLPNNVLTSTGIGKLIKFHPFLYSIFIIYIYVWSDA